MALDLQSFKDALSCTPTSVVVVTTLDHLGQPRGFTAGSFSSLSVDPPLVLVSLNCSAECHAAFDQAERFAVSVLGPEHEALAKRMATRGADKFGHGAFVPGPGRLPLAQGARATFVCHLAARYPGGDHTILVGAVEQVGLGGGEAPAAMVHFRRSFWSVGRSDAETGRMEQSGAAGVAS